MLRTHVIDQRIIQQRGGVCVKFPVSCLIRDFVSKYLNIGECVVLDVTYGQGRFYGAWPRPRFLIGADVRVWNWVVEPDVFLPKPVWALEDYILPWTEMVDLVVVDPPFHRRRYRRTAYSFYTGAPEVILRYAFKIARLLSNGGEKQVYLLAHYKEPVKAEGELERVEFKPYTRYLNAENTTTYFQLFRVG